MKKSLRNIMMSLLLGVSAVVPLVGAHAQEEAKPEVKMFVDSPVLQQQPLDHVMGNNNAPITIIEYASLSCSHCGDFHRKTLPLLKERYIDTGKARLILRNFPTNDPALKGALLLNCLEPEKYYTFAKVLFELQEKWAFDQNFLQNLQQIASVGGVSAEKFSGCMANVSLEKQVLEIRKEAGEALQIRSTPTFFINGHRFEGARDIDEFGLMMQKVLTDVKAKETAK